MEKEFAGAKVNLFLDVLNRRDDGYHNLGTVFQTLNMGIIFRQNGMILVKFNFLIMWRKITLWKKIWFLGQPHF